MLTWIEERVVGVGQDPSLTDDPARASANTIKWGAPEILVAPQYGGSFWFWTLAPAGEWEPKLGYASSLRDAQALTVWNKAKSTVLKGPYIRVPPYVFQPAQTTVTPSPQPTPEPMPVPTPPTPAPKQVARSSDFWKPTLTVGAIIAGIAALVWYAT